MSAWLHFALPVIAEILFFSAAIYCVFRAQKNRIYPALWQFLIFRVAVLSAELAEMYVRHLHFISGVHAYTIYVFIYWPSFLVSGILILRVLHEMFRHAVRSIPGLQQMGRSIFFWAVAVSAVIACASGTTAHSSGVGLLVAAGQVIARSQSVLALCLLTFLAFASNKLGVSFGSRIFGVTFGFGLMALGNLVNSAILTRTTLTSGAQFAFEAVYLASIAIWCVYFLRPEPARRLVTMSSTSSLMQWNEIALKLGNPTGQVAVSYPPSFMNDVIHLVNTVMGPQGFPATAVSSRPPGPMVG